MKEIEEWREGKTWLERGAEVGVEGHLDPCRVKIKVLSI